MREREASAGQRTKEHRARLSWAGEPSVPLDKKAKCLASRFFIIVVDLLRLLIEEYNLNK